MNDIEMLGSDYLQASHPGLPGAYAVQPALPLRRSAPSGVPFAPALRPPASDSEIPWKIHTYYRDPDHGHEVGLESIQFQFLLETVHALQRQLAAQKSAMPAWSPETQGRLAGPVKFVLRLLDTWKLDRRDAVPLLGFEAADWQHVENLLEGRVPLIGRDVKDRIAYLFHIRRTLASLFRDVGVENDWLREHHPLLNEKSPLDLLLDGAMENLLVVRDYVLTAAGK